MSGVDRLDQNVAYYRPSLRSKKWWFPVFLHVLDVAIQNAWILHKRMAISTGGVIMDQLSFRRHIAQYYCANYGTLSRSNIPSRPSGASCAHEVRYDNSNHLVEFTDRKNRCRYCNVTAKFMCRRCGVSLHPKCFVGYHTQP